MMKPDIAVVIVNWNSGRLLSRCLTALSRQTIQGFRVVVVDNASSDDSLNSLPDTLDLTLHRLDHNSGFAAANNIAVRHRVRAPWVALLNPDALPEPCWLERLLAAVAAYPDCVCFGSRLLQAEAPDRLDGTGDVYHVSGLVWRRGHGCPAQAYTQADEIFAPCAAAALYRREAFLAVGGFDEDYFCYLEDVDLGFRLRLAGHHCRYVPGAVVYHVGSATTGRGSDFSVYHGHRNLVWTFFKNMPLPLLLAYLPYHLLLNLVSLGVFAWRGQFRTLLRAKWHACLGLPKVLKKRRRVQALRCIPWHGLHKALDKGLPRPRRCR